METPSRTNQTIVGVFSNLSDAQKAADELRTLGLSTVKLVENDQDTDMVGTIPYRTSENNYEPSAIPTSHKEGGISGFFSRLFGFDDDRSTWNLGADSETYFQDTYNSKHHIVIIDNCSDLARCREVITSLGGTIEDQGSQYYERERYRDRGSLDTSMDSERVLELREEQLDVRTERLQTGEVRVRKEIITETQSFEVPVTREEIVVERRSLDGVPREGSLDISAIGETEVIRIPVSEEHVHVEKKVVPREEIRVSKQKITDNETVTEEVRREEARVESDGRVAMKNKNLTSPSPAADRKQNTNQPSI